MMHFLNNHGFSSLGRKMILQSLHWVPLLLRTLIPQQRSMFTWWLQKTLLFMCTTFFLPGCCLSGAQQHSSLQALCEICQAYSSSQEQIEDEKKNITEISRVCRCGLAKKKWRCSTTDSSVSGKIMVKGSRL